MAMPGCLRHITKSLLGEGGLVSLWTILGMVRCAGLTGDGETL